VGVLLKGGREFDLCPKKKSWRIWSRLPLCSAARTPGHMLVVCMYVHMERQCADTIGTVPVPWAGHFQCWNINIVFRIKYTEAILSNCSRKLLWFEVTKMLTAVLRNKFIVLFCIIFGTLFRSLLCFVVCPLPPIFIYSMSMVASLSVPQQLSPTDLFVLGFRHVQVVVSFWRQKYKG